MRPDGAGRLVVARVVVAGVAVTVLVVGGAGPALACSGPETVPLDRIVAGGSTTPYDTHPITGVVERRVIAHAPLVPILTTRRSAAVWSRTWGDVAGVDSATERYGAYLEHALMFIFYCPLSPTPRTGETTMTAVFERESGRRATMWTTEVGQRFDPTFPNGLTSEQERALEERFGPPRVLADPSPWTVAVWWLWAWLPWLGVVGAPAFLVARTVRRRRVRRRTRGIAPDRPYGTGHLPTRRMRG